MDKLFLAEILQIMTATSILFVWVVRYENIVREFKEYQIPAWIRDLVGILKISFAIMLLAGIYNENYKVLGSFGLVLLMLAALFIHIKVMNSFFKALPSLTLLTFSALILLIDYNA